MPQLSASQLKTSDGCLRQWAFKYLAELPAAAGAAAQLGKDCHTAWEGWLRAATPFVETAAVVARTTNTDPVGGLLHDLDWERDYVDRIVRVCTAGVRYLPPPMAPRVEVEGDFTFEDHGVQWRGYKDLVYQDAAVHVLHDHKTTSNLKWAKSAEVLRGDVQLNLYAQHEFSKHPALEQLEARWMYVTTGAQVSTRLVALTVQREQADHACADLAVRGKRLLELYDERPDPNLLPLPKDLSICRAYGGCPFEKVCLELPTGEEDPNELF